MKAIWNDQIIAESDNTIFVEGNHYFPPSSIHREFFRSSDKQTICEWKGLAFYYTVEVGDQQNKDAAWFYLKTSELASEIKGYIAFWQGIKIVD